MSRIYFILILLLTIISCGKTEEKKSNETEDAPKAAVKKEEVEIKIKALGNTMQTIAFDPKQINIPANSHVKFTLINESSEESMHHNFVLIKFGAGEEIAKAALETGPENDYIPKSNKVIVATKTLKPGESTSIEFDAPAKGSYHFICTFPGHYPIMIGRLDVQ